MGPEETWPGARLVAAAAAGECRSVPAALQWGWHPGRHPAWHLKARGRLLLRHSG